MDQSYTTDEYSNAIIEDYTCGRQQNYLFQVEHANNALPFGYQWSAEDFNNFSQTHWAYDIGALQLARYLAKQLKSVLVYSKYSRLYIDVNRTITCSNLFRRIGDGNKIQLNQDLTFDEEKKRINEHSSYYHTLKIAIERFQPGIIYDIHSFTSCYEGSVRDVEVGILSTVDGEFQRRRGMICKLNEPWTAADFYSFGLESSRHYDQTNIKQGLCFEVRNDFLVDIDKFQMICDRILQAIQVANENNIVQN